MKIGLFILCSVFEAIVTVEKLSWRITVRLTGKICHNYNNRKCNISFQISTTKSWPMVPLKWYMHVFKWSDHQYHQSYIDESNTQLPQDLSITFFDHFDTWTREICTINMHVETESFYHQHPCDLYFSIRGREEATINVTIEGHVTPDVKPNAVTTFKLSQESQVLIISTVVAVFMFVLITMIAIYLVRKFTLNRIALAANAVHVEVPHILQSVQAKHSAGSGLMANRSIMTNPMLTPTNISSDVSTIPGIHKRWRKTNETKTTSPKTRTRHEPLKQTHPTNGSTDKTGEKRRVISKTGSCSRISTD